MTWMYAAPVLAVVTLLTLSTWWHPTGWIAWNQWQSTTGASLEHQSQQVPELTCSNWCPGSLDHPVLVIGGGIAGITAASELHRMGCPVRVLEAKDHLGGRTYGEVQESGWTFNHGANWIHGAYPNPIWALNREKDLLRTQWLPRTYYTRTRKGVEREHGNDTYVPGQEMRNKFDQFTLQHAHFRSWLSLSCNGKFNSRDLPTTYFVSEYISSMNMSAEELDRFLLFYNAYETLDYAVDLYSASMINDLGRMYNRDREFMVADPYNHIVDFLAKDLDVVLSEPVSHVQYDSTGVQVRSRSGHIYNGSMAIVTIPVGVLKTADVAFEPPLPPWKQFAIDELRMGLLEKIAFEFDTPWWESGGATEDAFWTVKHGEHNGFKSTASEWYNLYNLLNKSGPPVLLTTPGGYYADFLEFESDDAVIALFRKELQTIFPHIEVPLPKKMLRTFHRKDEFMRGSYSSPTVGTFPLSMAYLGEPVANRLFFAGEATSVTRFGYVDGAYMTGLDTARKVLAECSSIRSPVPFSSAGLTSKVPPGEEEIRRRWRAEVEEVLQMTIPNCTV